MVSVKSNKEKMRIPSNLAGFLGKPPGYIEEIILYERSFPIKDVGIIHKAIIITKQTTQIWWEMSGIVKTGVHSISFGCFYLFLNVE